MDLDLFLPPETYVQIMSIEDADNYRYDPITEETVSQTRHRVLAGQPVL